MRKINLAVFASGTGTNFQNLYHYFKESNKIELSLLISNNSSSGAIDFAKEHQIAYKHISSKTHLEPDRAILNALNDFKINLIALAGYMKKLSPELVAEFEDRILNLHPSLLPKFGGAGMYGMNVHKAVIENKEQISGATVHLVNEEYDQGKILEQGEVALSQSDTPESLQKKVAKIEYQIYPIAIENYVNNMTK